jgi:hypothetical protein
VNGFIWVRIGTMEDPCKHSNELSGSITCRIIIMMITIMTTTTTHTLQINDTTVTAEISKFKSLTVNFLC